MSSLEIRLLRVLIPILFILTGSNTQASDSILSGHDLFTTQPGSQYDFGGFAGLVASFSTRTLVLPGGSDWRFREWLNSSYRSLAPHVAGDRLN